MTSSDSSIASLLQASGMLLQAHEATPLTHMHNHRVHVYCTIMTNTQVMHAESSSCLYTDITLHYTAASGVTLLVVKQPTIHVCASPCLLP
jgi:hypothetical protein